MNSEDFTPQGSPPPVPVPGPAQALPLQSSLPAEGFQRLLRRVQARQRRSLWVRGTCYGLAGATALLLATSYFAPQAPGLARAGLVLAPLFLAACLVAFGVVLSLRRVGDETRTARLVGRRLPELSLDLLSAVELQRALVTQPGFSPELAEAFLSEVSARAERADLRRVVDPRPARLAGAALAVSLLMGGVLAVRKGDRLFAGMQAALGRGAAAQQAVQREPVTGDVELTYRYPAYTGLAPRTVPGTNGEVTAPAGTEVELRTRADRDVGQAELVVGEQVLPLRVEGERDLKGSFVVKESGAYHVALRTAKGKLLAEGPDVPIHAQLDEVPKVSLSAPVEELEIDAGEKVTLKYEGSDDYGITGLTLVFKPPGASKEERVELSHDEGRRTRGQHVWDVTGTGLKLHPGQTVTYYLEVRDNDAVSGPKRGVSRTQVLKLYSAAEHRREATRRAELLWERLLLHLADRLEGPDREPQENLERVTAAQSVDQAGLALATELTTTAQDLSRERDVPPELLGALANIGDGTHRAVQLTQGARRAHLRAVRLRGDDPERGRRLAFAVKGEIKGLERDVLYLESLLDQEKLHSLRELAKQMDRDRRELAKLVEQYAKTQDPELQQQILKDIEGLRAQLEELMQRMAELAKGIRDEHLNEEALQELMAEQNMSGALDEVERLMRENKAEEALAKLQQLSMQMDKMLSQLDGAQDPTGAQADPELARRFGEFMAELDQTAERQAQVAEETKALRDKARRQARERIGQRAKAARDELLRKAEALTRDYRALPQNQLHSRAERPLDEALAELENVQNALKVEDYDLAADAAARAERAAQELSSYADHQRQLDELFQNPPETRSESRELSQRLAKDADKAQELNQRLQQLFPPPGAQLSEADRDRLKQLAQDQRALEKRAQALQQQMDAIGQMAPVFGPEQSEAMRQVGERMAEASQRLDGRDVSRAHGEQRAAAEGLQQFQKQMREGSQGRGGSGGIPLPSFARRGMGGQQQQEKVEIPDEDQFQTPKEFRQDLLDAMKQGAPAKYRDQVKRYYEELVK